MKRGQVICHEMKILPSLFAKVINTLRRKFIFNLIGKMGMNTENEHIRDRGRLGVRDEEPATKEKWNFLFGKKHHKHHKFDLFTVFVHARVRVFVCACVG